MHLTTRTALVATALAAALAAGCSKGTDSSQTTTTTTTTSTSAAPAATSAATTSGTASSTSGTTTASTGDPVHGKAIFSANCATCHGATGQGGGVGPTLVNEKSRKNDAAAIAWIKNPTAPMPKLYPDPLSEKDVDDVAAYVETL